jgi:hypothetical protein
MSLASYTGKSESSVRSEVISKYKPAPRVFRVSRICGVFSGQWTVGSGQWAVDSGQWAVGSGQWAVKEIEIS